MASEPHPIHEPVTVSDLPAVAGGIFLYCPDHPQMTFSATRGDYFWMMPTDVLRCPVCTEPMRLGVEHRTVEEL